MGILFDDEAKEIIHHTNPVTTCKSRLNVLFSDLSFFISELIHFSFMNQEQVPSLRVSVRYNFVQKALVRKSSERCTI